MKKLIPFLIALLGFHSACTPDDPGGIQPEYGVPVNCFEEKEAVTESSDNITDVPSEDVVNQTHLF